MTHHHARRSAACCKRQMRSRDHAITRSPEYLGGSAGQQRRDVRRLLLTVASVRSRPSLGGADPPAPRYASERDTPWLHQRARQPSSTCAGGLLGSPPPFLAKNTAPA